MKNSGKTKEDLINELESLKKQLAKAKKSYNQIQESEEKYSSIFENTNDLIQSVDAKGNFLFVNPAWKKKLGYSEEDLNNINVFQIIHPENIDHCKTEFNKILSGAKRHGIKTVFLTKSGNQIVLEGNITPLITNHQVVGTYAVYHDITERIKNEKELRLVAKKNEESLKRLNEAQRIAKTGSWNLDLITNKLTWSDEMYKVFGLQTQQFDVTFEAFLDNIHPDDREIVNKAYTDSVENKTPYEIEHRLLLKDGTLKYVTDKGETVYNDDGNPVFSRGTIQDRTEQVLIINSLADANLHLNAVFNNSLHTIIVATDPNGLITFFNVGAERMLGYTAEEMIGKQTPVIFHLESEVIAQGKELSREFGRPIKGFEVFMASAIHGSLNEREWIYIRKDGTHFTASLIVTAMKNDKGEITGLVGFGQDVTERQQVEKELQLINEINRVANSGDSQAQILHTAAIIISKALNFRTANIYLYNSGNNYITLVSMSLDPGLIRKIEKLSGLKLKNLKIPLYEGSRFTELIQKKQTQLQDDPVQSIKDYTDKPVLQAFAGPISKLIAFKSGIRVPLMIGDKIIGLIGVTSDKKYTNSIITSLERFADQLSLIINKIQIDESLRVSEEKFRAISTTATDGIIILNEKAETTFWNDAATNIFGFTAKESLGKDLHTTIVPKRYYKDYKKGFAKYLKTGKGPLVGMTREVTGQRKDGKEFPMEISMSAFMSGGNWNAVGIIRDITQRKLEREKYRTLFESSTDALMVLSRKGFIDCNQAMLDIFGIKSKDEFLLTQPKEISPPRQPDGKDSEEKARLMNELAYQNGSNRFEWTYRRRNGQDFPAEVLLSNMTIGNNEFLQATVTDITLRRQTEIKILEQQSMNNKIHSALWDIAQQKINETFSLPDFIHESLQAAFNIFKQDRLSVWLPNEKGFYLSAFIGTSENPEGMDFLSNIEYPNYIEFIRENKLLISNDVARDGRLKEFKEYFATTGTQSMLDISAVIDNEMVALICFERLSKHHWSTEEISFMRNLSDQYVQIFLRLEEFNSRVKQENIAKELRQFIDTANAPIFGIDMEGEIDEWNQTTENITLYSKEEVLGKKLVTEFISEDYKKSVKIVLDQALRGKETANYKFQINTKDKRRVMILLNASTRRDINGKIIGVLGIGQDITEMDKLAKELISEKLSLAEKVKERTNDLNIANAELAKAARMKDEFLANMSHELRTPLNTVLGLSEALQEEVYGSLNPKQAKSLYNIEHSGRHLLSLINEILDLAKIEAGEIELEYERIPVGDLVQGSLVFVKQIAMKKHIKISSGITGSIEYFNADPKRMKQILINLLSNAVKFTPETGEVALDVEVNEKNNKIDFCVKDTGIGIASEHFGKIFQPFAQIESSLSRKFDGTGLGLALVKKLTELHNGTISVESVVNKGSSFTVSIPLLQDGKPTDKIKESDSGPFDSVRKAPTTIADESQALILLAEDNESSIETTSDYLEAKQFRVIVARNGEEAVNSAQRIRPELILMDVQMPVMDGFTAIRKIRAMEDPYFKELPIIVLTALAMPGDKEKSLDAGANEYITKPVSLKNLVEKINEYLGKQ